MSKKGLSALDMKQFKKVNKYLNKEMHGETDRQKKPGSSTFFFKIKKL